MTTEERISEWLQEPFDTETQNAVLNLKQKPEKLEDAFYTSLQFGTGGMRGIMGVGTNRINKYTLGKSTQGLTHFLKKKYPNEQIKVVIAYDCRHQSKSLAKVVADVFTANGIYCYLFSDLRPTPELSFAVRHLNAHCGIVLTASHNPPEYNGYKVYGKEGGQLVPPEDKAVIQEIEKTTYDQIQFKGNATFIHYVDEKIDNVYQEVVLQEAKMELEDRSALQIVFTPIHGTSITAIPQVLKKAGYQNIHIVKEQETPDGDFSTVISPNPEEPEALKMAVALGDQKNADLVIGTDPDADRLGIVVRDLENQWYYLNGNQIMIVLTEYLLSKKQAQNQLTPQHFIASTIVSSPMIKAIAKEYKIQFKNCLTGFKWIAKLIEDHPELTFVGGGEESFGYLVGHQVRDKDAVSASLLACELASELKSQGKSIYKFLLECYQKYGVYFERLISITKEGKEGIQTIQTLMDRFRNHPPTHLGGISVLTIEDYLSGMTTHFKTNQKQGIDLPKADVLIFNLAEGSRISLRPSGTEPKIKFYFSVKGQYLPEIAWQEQQQQFETKIDKFVKDLLN
ncbi:phospho-sugar mutase [Flavobacteriaceae bacterium]|jgi:phosphoglucomutase|nr:phospho-sugar mutase [Flavobacteriaceae bacterium]MDC0386218.1 phospho-sugar mutase [Flavobacteriaceae bacterium]